MIKIHMFHGLGVGPDTLKKFEYSLAPYTNMVPIIRPILSHVDGIMDVPRSLRSVIEYIEPNDILIGNSSGGLVACAAQELVPGLVTICLNTPTREGMYHVLPLDECQPGSKRVVFYSTQDLVIQGANQWEGLCDSFYDLPFMGHNIEPHRQVLAHLINIYLTGGDLDEAYHKIMEGQTPIHRDPV